MLVLIILIAISPVLIKWYSNNLLEQKQNKMKEEIRERMIREGKISSPTQVLVKKDLEPVESLSTQTYRRFVSNAEEAKKRVRFRSFDKSESV